MQPTSSTAKSEISSSIQKPKLYLKVIEKRYMSKTPIDFYDYEEEKKVQEIVDLFNKKDDTYGQDELLEKYSGSAKKLLGEAKTQADRKTKSSELKKSIIESIKQSKEFKDQWEVARAEFKQWSEAELSRLQAKKSTKWFYSDWHWDNYDIQREILTFNNNGEKIEVPFSLQSIEKIQNAYNSRWKREQIEEGTNLKMGILRRRMYDNNLKEDDQWWEMTERRVGQSVRAEFSPKSIPLSSLDKYITPVLNTQLNPNRLAIVGNERQLLVEWEILNH